MTSELIECVNPGTGELFATVRPATTEEARQAVEEMREASGEWAAKTVKERARILGLLQKRVIDSVDELTEVINRDSGKSRQEAIAEVIMMINRLSVYRRKAGRWLRRRRVPAGLYPFRKYYTEQHPFGVVAVIGPWNYPLELALSPVISALLAGNTVVLKPSEVTAATGLEVEILISSVPELAPYVRVVHGGAEAGAAIVAAEPDLVFLTGSRETGRKVALATANSLTPYLCELGGKDAMIVLEDADVDAAARWGVWGAFYTAGQNCVGIERVYVVEAVYEQFLAAVDREVGKLTCGYSSATANLFDVGPLVFDQQAEIAMAHLDDALAKGAVVRHGGTLDGLLMAPTVLTNVSHDMVIMTKESFAPFMPIMKVSDEKEAIEHTNDSLYDLSASIWSADIKHAERLAHQLEVGSVCINDALAQYGVAELPFGGYRESGQARTHGRQDVLQFSISRSFSVGRPPRFIDLASRMRSPGNYWFGKAIVESLFGMNMGQRLRAIRTVIRSRSKS